MNTVKQIVIVATISVALGIATIAVMIVAFIQAINVSGMIVESPEPSAGLTCLNGKPAVVNNLILECR